jgi:hypothetical protein
MLYIVNAMLVKVVCKYRYIVAMQISREGPFFSCRDKTIRSFIASAQSAGVASCTEDLPGDTSTQRDGSCRGDFQAIIQGTQTSINSGPTDEAVQQVPKKVSKLTLTAMQIFELGKKNWVANVDSIFTLPSVCEQYMHDIIVNEVPIRRYVQSAVEMWSRQCANKAYFNWDSIYHMLSENNASFGVDDFMSRHDSFEILKWWIRNNFVDHVERVLMLKPWFDKKLGKRNTLLMVGPPSCGKTLFADAILRLGLFRGSILNYAKGNGFCFMDTVNCRIIMHDECEWPLQAPEYTETLKKIWGGQVDAVNVKFKTKQMSSGAPVIACANQSPVKDPKLMPAVMKRVWPWNFQSTADMDVLHQIDDVPAVYGPYHPMAIFDLYNYYNNDEYLFDE